MTAFSGSSVHIYYLLYSLLRGFGSLTPQLVIGVKGHRWFFQPWKSRRLLKRRLQVEVRQVKLSPGDTLHPAEESLGKSSFILLV